MADTISSLTQKIGEIDNKLSTLNYNIEQSIVRFNSWSDLCSRQKCDTNAYNIIAQSKSDIESYKSQIATLQAQRATYQKSLDSLTEIAKKQIPETPQEREAKTKKYTIITVVSLLIVGFIVWWKFFKNKN
ncbi:MAG: hypothetical protein IT243_06035 [Bacteroidia bacterium]|nr:hypothetical protein [Bacteroidia bacterium]